MITYVTRSALFRFPDYTTVRHRDAQIEIYGRLRFGRSDLGVNAARIDRWLERFRRDDDRQPSLTILRHIGLLSDIWHWAMNMRPSTCRQIISPSSTRPPVLSVQ